MALVSFDDYTKQVIAKLPAVWPTFYPRAYENVGQYGSPKLPAITLMANAISPLDAHGRKVIYVQACQLQQLEVPTYFITRDLLFALSETDLPNDYELKEFQMKWPAVLFMLPRDMNHDSTGIDHPYLLLSQMVEPGEFCLRVPGYTEEQSKRTFPTVLSKTIGMTVTTSAYEGGHTDSRLTTYNYSVVPAQTPTLGEALQIEESDTIIKEREAWHRAIGKSCVTETDLHTMMHQPLTHEEGDFSKRCLKLAMKIALFMESKKEMVEMGKPKKTFKPKDNRPDICWPNIVGRSYRIRYVYDKSDEDVPDGLKRHVRFHWRRGFMRWQWYGKGLTERKRVLIEGRMVGSRPETVSKPATTP